MDENRRRVIGVALAGASIAAFAKDPISELKNSKASSDPMGVWSSKIEPYVKQLKEPERNALFERHGVSSYDELSLTLAKRYPTLSPTMKPGDVRLKFLSANPLADQGDYEKGPKHDKEPYDKSTGYDRGGFGRTFDVVNDFKKFTNFAPDNNVKVK